MKTIIAILNGGIESPKVSIRKLGIGLIYAIGFAVVLLQLRSLL